MRDDAVAGQRIGAAIGEEEPGPCELAAAHRQRALMEIDAEHQFGGMVQLAVGAHEIGERDVAETRRLLRARHRLVDDDVLLVGEIAQEPHDLADGLLRRMAGEYQVGDGDGPGIDEGVARNAALVFELDDGVEGRT